MVTIFICSTMSDLDKELDKSIGVALVRKLNKIPYWLNEDSNLEKSIFPQRQKICSLPVLSWRFIDRLKNET